MMTPTSVYTYTLLALPCRKQCDLPGTSGYGRTHDLLRCLQGESTDALPVDNQAPSAVPWGKAERGFFSKFP